MSRYFESPTFKDLLARYEKSLRDGESVYMDADDLTDIADYYQEKGQGAEAKQAAEYALKLFPGAASPLAFMARLALMEKGDTREARQLARQIDDKSDLEYLYIMAEIMLAEGKADEADRYMDEHYQEMDDEDRPDFVLDTATLFADYDQFLTADKWLHRSDETDEADYRELQGRIALGTGHYEESEAIFNELLDEDPWSGFWWNSLAMAQFMHNHINESITSSEYSIAINPNDDDAILNKANGLYSLGNYEEALRYYERFKQLRPSEEVGDMFIGMTLLQLNKPEEALKHFLSAERISEPDSPNLCEIYQQTALTYSHLGQLDNALSYMDKALSLDDADTDELMVGRGHLLLENGRLEEARHAFITAMRHSGGEPHILLDIAISIYDCGYIRLAYRMLKVLVNSDIDAWNDGYAYLAACCYDLDRHEEFLTYLRLACEKNPVEARHVLSEIFPEGMPPEEYYQYAVNGLEI